MNFILDSRLCHTIDVLVSLIKSIPALLGYLMPKQCLYKNRHVSFQPIAKANKGVHIFPKGISPKVNIITQLMFKLAYVEVAVQHFHLLHLGELS